MRTRALACTVLAILVLIASGCTLVRHGPSPVTVTAVVKPPPPGNATGTVVIRFKTSPGWGVVIGEDHPLMVKVVASDGIVFSPACPSFGLPKRPGAFYAIPNTSDPLKVLLHYQVLDRQAVPADVKMSLRYTRYSPDDDQGQFGYEDLVVTIPK